MPQNAFSIEKIKSLAAKLINTKIINAERTGKGKNNKVYRIETIDALYALKMYSKQKFDSWNRLGTEFGALKFLYSNGLTCVPKPYVENTEYNCALYQWIEGQPVPSASLKDIDIAASFLLKIQGLVGEKMAKRIGNASASCFSVLQVLNQIDKRLNRLVEVSSESRDLDIFLRKNFTPAYLQVSEKVQTAISRNDMDEHSVLDANHRALSPSDFGFHNTLRSLDGSLIFFDFEYFGWDDPVKMVSDVVLHPGNMLPTRLQKHFYHRMCDYYNILVPNFSRRFQITLPLYALIWCLIMLGDFLPDQWERRIFAGENALKDEFQKKQLTHAQRLLKKLIAPGFSDSIISNIGMER